MSWWGRAWSGLRACGHALFYALMGSLCVFFIVLGVIAVTDRDRSTYWGTFSEVSTTCDSGPRGGCTSAGRWVSDDGTIVKDRVVLDGGVEPGGVVRASYRPGGPIGDDENNIVHTAFWTHAGPWLPWLFAPLTATATVYYRSKWRRQAEQRRYQGRHTEASTRS